MSLAIRPERSTDIALVREVNEAAFKRGEEADLVDELRRKDKIAVSLVAESERGVVGHIAFSRVKISSSPALRGVGLGPMAVLPAHHRRGVGSQLVREGLRCCGELGWVFAVVLGHPDYYRRFGFVSARRFGLHCVWEVPEGVFMAQEIAEGALVGHSGLVTYEPEFGDV